MIFRDERQRVAMRTQEFTAVGRAPMVGAADDGGRAAGWDDPRGWRHERLLPRDGAVAAARAVAVAGLGRPGWRGRAAVGVVLGTGLGVLADRLEDAWSIPARDTGWLASSTATGHAGRVVVGRIGGRAQGCWVAALQGRVHGYEGHAPELLTRGVEVLAALGTTTLLLTNAAGGLRPDMRVGELVVLSDHIDFVRRSGPAGLAPRGTAAACTGPTSAFYDAALVERALCAARSAAARARAGVYAHLLGPSYETRAEYRMLRRLGADVVGMSTVPEAVVARRLGLRVAAVSVVTNVARPDAADKTDAEDVCLAAAGAADGVWAILQAIAADCTGAEDGAGAAGDARQPGGQEVGRREGGGR
jgi:purine-nucleoside phosphorylase